MPDSRPPPFPAAFRPPSPRPARLAPPISPTAPTPDDAEAAPAAGTALPPTSVPPSAAEPPSSRNVRPGPTLLNLLAFADACPGEPAAAPPVLRFLPSAKASRSLSSFSVAAIFCKAVAKSIRFVGGQTLIGVRTRGAAAALRQRSGWAGSGGAYLGGTGCLPAAPCGRCCRRPFPLGTFRPFCICVGRLAFR